MEALASLSKATINLKFESKGTYTFISNSWMELYFRLF